MPIRRQPNGTYVIQFQLLGHRVHRSAHTRSAREARALEEELRQKIRRGTFEDPGDPDPIRMTLGEATERYVAQHLAPKSQNPRSLNSSEVLLRRLVKLLGGPGVDLATIREPQVAQLKDRLLGDGSTPATVNQYLAYLRALLRRGRDEWGVTLDVPSIRLLTLRNARSRCLSEEEEARLMEALERRPALRDLVRFLLQTGARLREATGLRWQDVDLEAGRVTFLKTKNGSSRTVPLTKPAVYRLAQCPGGNAGCPWVLPYWSPTAPPRQYLSPHRAFRTACDRAGVEDFKIHDLRHTYASRLVSRGASLLQVSRLLGHRDIRMTQRYSHLGVDDLSGVVALLDRDIPG